MSVERIAVELLKCVISWDPEVCIVGNVTAFEIAQLAASVIDTCPKCGATAWVNIDCDLCRVASDMMSDTPTGAAK
jgi:predicted RNA-binding Zn-ribbon protein involved in translation (DUF1610 family)